MLSCVRVGTDKVGFFFKKKDNRFKKGGFFQEKDLSPTSKTRSRTFKWVIPSPCSPRCPHRFWGRVLHAVVWGIPDVFG